MSEGIETPTPTIMRRIDPEEEKVESNKVNFEDIDYLKAISEEPNKEKP